MTLQQLKYFDVMSRVLHYTEAARQLYVSQPSLSHSLAELEKELGVFLIEKQGKKSVLTTYGVEFQRHVRQALLTIDQGVDSVRQMRQPTSMVQLGYIYSFSFDYMPNAISGFCAQPQNAGISFNFFQGLNEKLLDKLRMGDLHLVLGFTPQNGEFCSEPVYEQKLFLAVPKEHRLSGRGNVSLSELEGEKLIALSPSSNLRSYTDRMFEQAGFIPKIVLEAEECNAMASFVGNRFGLAIMPAIPSLESYRVSLLTITGLPMKRYIHIIWCASRPLPAAVESFKEYVLSTRPFLFAEQNQGIGGLPERSA